MNLTGALGVLAECGVFDKIPQDGLIGLKELAAAADMDESVVRKRSDSIDIYGILRCRYQNE